MAEQLFAAYDADFAAACAGRQRRFQRRVGGGALRLVAGIAADHKIGAAGQGPAQRFPGVAAHNDGVPKRRALEVRKIGRQAPRSEEHTSELQSLMRISYAVFCLKKKSNASNEVARQHDKHLTESIEKSQAD